MPLGAAGVGELSRFYQVTSSDVLAEREGFEPQIGLHLCRISSAVHSTTLPPLLKAPSKEQGPCGWGR